MIADLCAFSVLVDDEGFDGQKCCLQRVVIGGSLGNRGGSAPR